MLSGEQRATGSCAEVACSAPPRRSGRRILGTDSASTRAVLGRWMREVDASDKDDEEEDKKAVPSKPRKVTPKTAII